jgi:hypothetical protein
MLMKDDLIIIYNIHISMDSKLPDINIISYLKDQDLLCKVTTILQQNVYSLLEYPMQRTYTAY